MSLLAIDIGGTTIKYTLYDKGKLGDITSVKTPIDLESFYHCLSNIVEQAKKEHIIQGVAISSPGAVNKNTGVIEGASALPYIHGFNIQSELETLFALPVSIENDANCAALAEVAFGAAKGCTTALLLVLGTGVGGAVVIDGKVASIFLVGNSVICWWMILKLSQLLERLLAWLDVIINVQGKS